MSQHASLNLLRRISWTCSACRSFQASTRCQQRPYSKTSQRPAEVAIRAAPEINFQEMALNAPARVIPASPSYFTGSPVFNDNMLLLQTLVTRHQAIPTVMPEHVPRMTWLRLSQYRSSTGEKIPASKYALLLRLLTRLNRIHPHLRPEEVGEILEKFRRPGIAAVQRAKPGIIDEHGRAKGVGRRKASSAKVYLVEGDGQIMVNGKTVQQAFPRLHDRESALWPLKITERLDKYNVFALAAGGGLTGQAEAITLGLARALLIHEPALKPALRRAGCVTRDPRRVERKKPGRRKARKAPQWVKR